MASYTKEMLSDKIAGISYVTVAFCDVLLQEVYKIPKLTVEERKRTERELGKMLLVLNVSMYFLLSVVINKQ